MSCALRTPSLLQVTILLARLLLALTFGWSAVTKVAEPEAFRATVDAYNLLRRDW